MQLRGVALRSVGHSSQKLLPKIVLQYFSLVFYLVQLKKIRSTISGQVSYLAQMPNGPKFQKYHKSKGLQPWGATCSKTTHSSGQRTKVQEAAQYVVISMPAKSTNQVDARRTTVGTYPPGSMWTANPILPYQVNCLSCFHCGSIMETRGNGTTITLPPSWVFFSPQKMQLFIDFYPE